MFEEVVTGQETILDPVVLKKTDQQELKAGDELAGLATLYTKPKDFCEKLGGFPPEAQFWIVKTLTHSDILKEPDAAMYPVAYKVYFETSGVGVDHLGPWREVEDGLTFQGENLKLNGMMFPKMPEGYSRELLEETLLGTTDIPKEMNPFLFIALNAKKVEARRTSPYLQLGKQVEEFAKKKGFIFTDHSPKAAEILHAGWRVKEGDTRDWKRRVR